MIIIMIAYLLLVLYSPVLSTSVEAMSADHTEASTEHNSPDSLDYVT